MSHEENRGRTQRKSGLARILGRALIGSAGLVAASAPGFGQTAPSRAFVPYADPPIRYLDAEVRDPVARLQARIDAGEVRLEHEARRGYLDSVLKLLDIPESSQTLVFSKTSLQYRKISPQAPRALYFNDNVYVGWVRGGDLLEVASFDPDQGAIFYVLEQAPSESPALMRASIDCTQCHVGRETRGVPGVFLRSVATTATGAQAPRARPAVAGHETPLAQRFGGWYVTGRSGGQENLGNRFTPPSDPAPAWVDGLELDPADLAGRFPSADYLHAGSDLVAQLVLAHQTQAHNLITLVNYKTRIALHPRPNTAGAAPPDADAARAGYESAADELVRYLLFADEAPLEGPVSGSADFARAFTAPGPRDPRGRSLRDFDLQRRIFRYPCSYLIYSDAFDAIPEPARSLVLRKLLAVLTGRDQDPRYARLSQDDRSAIREILVATKPNLPDEWRQAPAAEPPTAAAPQP